MMLSEVLLRFVGWGIATFFVFTTAYLIYRPLKGMSPSINLLIYLFLTIFVSSTIIMITGLLGVLRANFLVGLCAIGLVFYGILPPIRHSLGEGWQTARAFGGMFGNWWVALPRWVRWVLGIFVIYSTLRFFFLVVSLPPFVWDSLVYHLPNVAHWVQAGRIELFDIAVLRIHSPANYEVFTSWFTVFLHHDAFIEASGIPAYVLAFVSVYAIGRRLNLARWSAVLGAIAYATTPALILATTGTKNDPIMAALFLAAMAILLDITRRRAQEDLRLWGEALVLVLILFYALGTKTYLLHLGPGLIVVGVLSTWHEKSIMNWLSIPVDFIKAVRARGALLGVLVVLLLTSAVFLGTYWYVRNWTVTGNPFYPYGIAVSGSGVLESTAGAGTAQVGFANLFENIDVLMFKFWDRQFPVVPDLPDTTGWGWVAYGLGLVAMIWAAIRSPKYRIVLAGFIVALLTLYTTGSTSRWNMRYQIWFPAVLAIAVGLVFGYVRSRGRKVHAAYAFLFLLCTVLNLSMTVAYNRVSIEKFQQMLSIPLWEREAGTFRINMPEEYKNPLKYVPVDEVLGQSIHANGFVYPLYRADFSQELAYIPIEPKESCESIAQKMRAASTRWLFVAGEHSEDTVIGRMRACANEGSVIRERAKGLYVIE